MNQNEISVFKSYFEQLNKPKIIWCDESVNSTTNDFHKKVLSIFSELNKFQDIDSACKHLEANKRNSYNIIVSGALGKELVKKINDRSNVNKIWIFCQNKENHLKWAKDYAKVSSVENIFLPILSGLISSLPQQYGPSEINSITSKLNIPEKSKIDSENPKTFKLANLLWYDPRENDYENKHYAAILNLIYNLKKFNKKDDAIEHLKNNEVYYYVIIPGNLGEEFVKQAWEMKNVGYIYVFCSKKKDHLEWASKYKPKLKSVEDDFVYLLKLINEEAQNEYLKKDTENVIVNPNNISTNFCDKKESNATSISESTNVKKDFNKSCSTTQSIKTDETDKLIKRGESSRKRSKFRIISETFPEEEKASSIKSKPKIMWLDPELNVNENADNFKLVNSLGKLITVKPIDIEDAVSYIQKDMEPCHIITSGSFGKELLKKIYKLEHVKYVYIFCYNVEYHSTWSKDYKPKVYCVENEFKSLFSKLKSSLEELENTKEVSYFLPIFNKANIEEVNSFNELLTSLNKNTRGNQADKDFLEFYKKINNANSEIDFKSFNEQQLRNWFVDQPSTSQLINDCLISADKNSIFSCRLPITNIESLIKKQYVWEKDRINFSGVVYSSINLSNQEWSNLFNNIGKDIQIKGFLRANQSKEIGFKIIESNQKVLLTIIIPDGKGKFGEQAFMCLKDPKNNSSSRDFIFNVKSKFELVNAINEKEDKHLILLYGAFEFKTYMNICQEKVIIKPISNPRVVCTNCHSFLSLGTIKNPCFINLFNQEEIICSDCYCDPNFSPKKVYLALFNNLFMKKNNLKTPFDIYGFLIDNIPINLLNIRCSQCGMRELTRFFTCLKCELNNNWCFNCLKSRACQNDVEHLIVSQNNDSIFWSKRLSKEFQLMIKSECSNEIVEK